MKLHPRNDADSSQTGPEAGPEARSQKPEAGSWKPDRKPEAGKQEAGARGWSKRPEPEAGPEAKEEKRSFKDLSLFMRWMIMLFNAMNDNFTQKFYPAGYPE